MAVKLQNSARGRPSPSFRRPWGTSAIDNASRKMRVWDRLSCEEREAALAAIPRFMEAMAAAGRTMLISGWRYLEERKWERIALTATDGDWVDVIPLSCEWWAPLLHKIGRGEKVGFFLRYTSSNTRPYPCRRQDIPTVASIAQLKWYPSDGEVMAAWRTWFMARGVRPPVRESPWVFLPSERPPTDVSS
jgi:hypothetical protein